jgi:hypothetical protein
VAGLLLTRRAKPGEDVVAMEKKIDIAFAQVAHMIKTLQ